MKLRITIDIFSGRENPVIELSARESKEALERLLPTRKLKRAEAIMPTNNLGYRGMVIEQVGAGSRRLPRSFRVVNGSLFGLDLKHRSADENFEDFISDRSSIIRRAKMGKDFDKFLVREVRRYRKMVDLYDYKKPKWPIKPRCICAPLYEPSWWNDSGQRQFNNNCYNYATNYRSDTFAQPGRAAGSMYSALTCAAVRPAAELDELIRYTSKKITCPKNGHLVALVVAPGWDFHWYRMGANRKWTHKPGSTAVTHLDNSGHVISDPRTADRGSYTQFCGFMIVMHGHIKIN
jgi:hypothetical protein